MNRSWSRGDQWFLPGGQAGNDSNMWDLADYDELSNGPWDEDVMRDERLALLASDPVLYGYLAALI